MAQNFPSNPVLGDQFENWIFDGTSWKFAQALPGGLPCGSVITWSGATAPPNWLLCDGTAVSRTTYSSLFAVVGTSYGNGDGSTTFNLPDLRGRVPVGKNAGTFGTLGSTGGAETHTLTEAQMPSHTHIQNAHTHNQSGQTVSNFTGYGQNSAINGNAANPSGLTVTGSTTATNQNAGGGQAHNNLQPYQVLNYIIKHTVAVTPGESELAPRVSSVESVNVTQNSRLTSLETADATINRAGLVPVVPATVTVSSGSATISPSGRVLITANAGTVSLNGIFSAAYTGYRIHIEAASTNNDVYLHARLRNAGTDITTANYYSGGYLGYSNSTSSTWAAAGTSMWYIGSTAALSNGRTPFDIELHSPYETTFTKGTSLGVTASSGSGIGALMVGLANFGTASYDSLTFYMGSGSVAAGVTIQVYGYR